MIIGTFVYDYNTDTYNGDISTLHCQLIAVEISPVKKMTENSRDYRLTAQATHGEVEFGSGWRRTSKEGREYVSVSIDGPLSPAPFSAAVFLEEDAKTARMVWNRHKPKEERESEAAIKSRRSK